MRPASTAPCSRQNAANSRSSRASLQQRLEDAAHAGELHGALDRRVGERLAGLLGVLPIERAHLVARGMHGFCNDTCGRC
ncbi:hypothetical protein BE20_28550 [Sorangium cellulosum]|uniref:Uncharacterized protein n=1 Tax=Sorangium cellulosum TaxID=56 RepID=A0A150S293_SORCE|nr:hypothetical protein BE20_28550 [Sorangium cellulosum]KYF87101.1 hypothetical protein BE18_23215 [Sorangium cellulosum]